jgi:hypothetical protein
LELSRLILPRTPSAIRHGSNLRASQARLNKGASNLPSDEVNNDESHFNFSFDSLCRAVLFLFCAGRHGELQDQCIARAIFSGDFSGFCYILGHEEISHITYLFFRLVKVPKSVLNFSPGHPPAQRASNGIRDDLRGLFDYRIL